MRKYPGTDNTNLHTIKKNKNHLKEKQMESACNTL